MAPQPWGYPTLPTGAPVARPATPKRWPLVLVAVVSVLVALVAVGVALSDDDKVDVADSALDGGSADTGSYEPTDEEMAAITENPEVQRIALDVTWDKMTVTDQQDLCEGVDMVGLKLATDVFLQGANDDGEVVFDRQVVEEWLTDHC